jgi:3-phosphoshikimate 1-carboxyvinyltransferase
LSALLVDHSPHEVGVARPAKLRGTIVVPGDKSISHRAALMNALARGRATITNYSPGADCLSTLGCLRELGVPVEYRAGGADGSPVVRIGGMAGAVVEPTRPLDAGNSGTTMRLFAGALAGQPIFSVLVGDASLSARPMARVVEPLRLMGAQIVGRQGGRFAPLAIDGGGLRGIEYESRVASAQVKSCLLLAGVQADGETVVRAPALSRDHTERLLRAQGARVASDGTTVSVNGGAALQAVDVAVPGDFSSAAYWLALGCIHPDAEVVVRDVGTNPGRTGFLDILRAMGGDLELRDERDVAGEPRATVVARSSRLRGVQVGGDLVPRAIDELPLVAVLGLFAEGVTEIRDAGELRVKESDRIASVGRELARLGGRVEERPDGMRVEGGRLADDAQCETYADHRLAMSLAVAGLAGPRLRLRGADCVRISYPAFWDDARTLGASIRGLAGAAGSSEE